MSTGRTPRQEELYDSPDVPDGLTVAQEELYVDLFRRMVEIIERTEAEREKSEVTRQPCQDDGAQLLSRSALYHSPASLASLQEWPEHRPELPELN